MLLFLLICLHVCRCFWFCRCNCCCSVCFLLMFLISVISFDSVRVLVDVCPFSQCCCCFCSSSSFFALLLDLEAPLLFLLSAHLPSFLSLLLTLAAQPLLLLFPHLLLFISSTGAIVAVAFQSAPIFAIASGPAGVVACWFLPWLSTVVAFAVSVFLFPAQRKAITQLMLADVEDDGPALIKAFAQM